MLISLRNIKSFFTGLEHPRRHSSECTANAESTEDTLRLLLETKAVVFVITFLYVGIMYKESKGFMKT